MRMCPTSHSPERGNDDLAQTTPGPIGSLPTVRRGERTLLGWPFHTQVGCDGTLGLRRQWQHVRAAGFVAGEVDADAAVPINIFETQPCHLVGTQTEIREATGHGVCALAG